ncbi:hypothetical protein [Streptomyces sp. JH34]|uniref:hypothetical protein n=1 Tax=Streptomyces sp. JH34 TaxID=2793633 RepID=UPI0023F6239C|nr:hypothetical protein [Streptomyces sp. JH34]MDF6023061.1 hypothetical protein [Streptomyces sp. JH34]
MPISARNPGRARLTVTLLGLAIAVTGLITWGDGDVDYTGAQQQQINASASAWGDVLGFDSTSDEDMALADQHLHDAESQKTFGIVLGVFGLALVGARWLIQPAPAVTTAKSPAEATLTPEQQQQAIDMYLEAQRRAREGQ